MKRSESIIKDLHYIVIDNTRVVESSIDAILGYMKESAWGAWKERFIREVKEKSIGSLKDFIDPPLIAQKFEFEKWWNEEVE
jgi:hypothetical protein